ncbi:MAG: hypothetical protein IKR92_02420 [Alphaproteobacteria bacterium]|nr:hypothetical protein [Alphaproteobacteria bacterium]
MTYISKQFAEEVILPDGSVASSVADVDKYLRTSGLARASDYSPEYINNVRAQNEKRRQEELFADFLYNYKRMIWK